MQLRRLLQLLAVYSIATLAMAGLFRYYGETWEMAFALATVWPLTLPLALFYWATAMVP